MPSSASLDLPALLARAGHHLPVIFVTAHEDPALMSRLLESGAVACLLKPFSEERFEAALERARQRIGQKMPDPAELAARVCVNVLTT